MGDQAYPKSLTSWAGVVSARKSPAQMANQMATQWRREWRRDTELRAQTAKHMATQWHLIWRRNTQSPSSEGVAGSSCVSFSPFPLAPRAIALRRLLFRLLLVVLFLCILLEGGPSCTRAPSRWRPQRPGARPCGPEVTRDAKLSAFALPYSMANPTAEGDRNASAARFPHIKCDSC